MLGLHAFTGNDYLSSFFRKGKERCWKLMQKYEEFEVCFTKLGSEPNLSEDLFEFLEEYNAGRSLKKKKTEEPQQNH